MNDNNIIVKRNELISRAAYRIDHMEQLILLAALSEVESKEAISDNHMYNVNIAQLAASAGVSKTSFYSNIKNAAQKLKRREISIPSNGGKTLVSGFIQSYEYQDSKGSLSIRFNKDIIPYISLIKDSFVAYKFKQVAKFKSSYSVRLYELLIQRLDISNIRIIELHDLRHLFQLGKSYELYSNIKLKVITPAMKDINTYSDINVIYKEIRAGRKVTALEFHIEALEPRPITKKQIEKEALPGETYGEVKDRLKEEKEPKKTPFWKNLFK